MFLMAATTLHCFNISKHTKNGRDVTPTEELVTGLVRCAPDVQLLSLAITTVQFPAGIQVHNQAAV